MSGQNGGADRRVEVKYKPGPKPLNPGELAPNVSDKHELIAKTADRLVDDGTWPSYTAVAAAHSSLTVSTVARYRAALTASRQRWVVKHGDHPQWTGPEPDPVTQKDGCRSTPQKGPTADPAKLQEELVLSEARLRRMSVESKEKDAVITSLRGQLSERDEFIRRLQAGIRPAVQRYGEADAEFGRRH